MALVPCMTQVLLPSLARHHSILQWVSDPSPGSQVERLQDNTCSQHGGIEQMVARWAHNPEVVGSIPSPASIC